MYTNVIYACREKYTKALTWKCTALTQWYYLSVCKRWRPLRPTIISIVLHKPRLFLSHHSLPGSHFKTFLPNSKVCSCRPEAREKIERSVNSVTKVQVETHVLRERYTKTLQKFRWKHMKRDEKYSEKHLLSRYKWKHLLNSIEDIC